MFDGEAFGAEIVAHVKSHVSNSIAPLLSEISLLKARIAELEAREPERGEKGEPGDPGHDGKDAEIPWDYLNEQLSAGNQINLETLSKVIADKFAELPKPHDGKDGRDGEDGRDGKDGIGIASAFIDREGNLVLTFTDGTVGSVGKVVGGEGPPGKDGTNGKDGRDGFGFEDMSVTLLEDGHTVELKFVRGDLVKTFELIFPNSKYCNIWAEDRGYMIGDLVTWAGSMWHCNSPTKDKPGSGSASWTLATKRGRDGKDGRDGGMGPPGPIGPCGRDLTQMDFSGAKF